MNADAPTDAPSKSRRIVEGTISAGVALVLIVLVVLAVPRLRGLIFHKGSGPQDAADAPASVRLAPGQKDALQVDPDAAQKLGIRTLEAKPATLTDFLNLSGTLTLDAGLLQEVRSRFAGEVVEIGKKEGDTGPVQFGDNVKKGQLMAVVWSRELGEKKSELIDAISQLHVDTETLKRLTKLFEDGTIPERQYRDAERAVETDRIAVSRVLRTLETWRVAKEEIQVVEAEANRLIEGQTQPSDDLLQQWARVEIRAALDGAVLEANIAVGDLVAPEDDLFEIADLSRLRVLAYAYEEDLAKLDTLPEDRLEWKITIPADANIPAQEGRIEHIGQIIDPTQHTALIMGWVDNPAGRLRAGQFITAAVELPPPGNEVQVPASAVVQKGDQNYVFVQLSAEPVYVRRSVSLSRQVDDVICLHTAPTPDEQRLGVQPVKPGEVVVVSGAVELQQSLTDLESTQ